MDQQCLIGDPGTSWSPTTTPGSDIIEEEVEVVQQTPVRPRISTACIPRQFREPLRRRAGAEERRDSFGKRMYDSFEISVIDSRGSIDGSESATSAFTMITSAASSCTDPWSSSGGGGYVEEEDDDGDVSWVQEDDVAVVPKLEPMEDEDINMADLEMKESVPPETPSATSTPAQAKRPRGRPRKHPKPTPESQAKITKGRSKTGCITCRKRKKKCDEAKPGCMNCEKNSVQCEGYPEKTIWKSGKEKAEEARLRRAGSYSTPTIMSLPPVINGVESEGDRMFFQHYITRLSLIFTVEGDQNSAFKKMLLPIALHHTGLMHSILALSGKHIDYASSYGRQFLQEHPNVDVESLEERSQYHHDEAVKELVRVDKEGDSNVVTNATYGQILCLVLQTLSDPKPTGQHRFHLQHYQRLVEESPPENGDFLKFIHEFFQYHICADELIALPTDDTRILGPDDWNLPSTVLQPAAVRLLGVSDGLFVYMSKITNIRNTIRENMEAGADIVVDFTSLYRAAEIDAGIRDWQPAWPEGDSRDLAGLLYKQMMWVYLWRTIYPPKATKWEPNSSITQAVDDGLKLLETFSPRDPSQTLILAPAFVIGCAAFEPRQREPIRKAITIVRRYTEYKNSDTALLVLEEVWRLMDKKDERSWDWQSIAHNMGMDFLAT